MKHKSHMLLLTGILFLLTACGSKTTDDFTKQALEAIDSASYQEAVELTQQAVLAGESKMLAYRLQGIAYMESSEYEEAVTAFKTALDASDGTVDDWEFDINYYLAEVNYKMENYEDAIDSYNAILELRSKETQAYYLRGISLLKTGKVEQAQADFVKAISLDKTNYTLLLNIYHSLKENDNADIGKSYIEETLTLNDKTLTDFDKGRMYYALEDYENARNSLELSRELGTEKVYLLLGQTYEALGDNNYAITVYEEYLAIQADSIPVMNQLALCEMKQVDYEAALTNIEKAMKIENNSYLQILKFNEIVCYEYLNDFDKAAVLMESYLESYPDDEDALREYTFLSTR